MFAFPVDAGIPDFILLTRRERTNRFLRIYQSVRMREEWGNGSPEYILHLPFKDVTGKHAGNWRIRSRTFGRFIKDLAQTAPPSAAVLDLGAGNCWLSVRLRILGYRVTSVDVNLDERDGLRAARAAQPHVPSLRLVRAEFENLPFPNGSFDIVVLNSSLHYSKDPERILLLLSQLLKPGGAIYVLDSPVYRREEDGNAMIEERREEIRRNLGTDVPEELSGSFLTYERIQRFAERFSVQELRPKHGVFWRLRPVVATLFLRRQPASFPIIKLTTHTGGVS